MIPLAFGVFVGFSVLVALFDWRRGWTFAVICGVLEDPVRKLMPGGPVVVTFSIALVFAAILFSGYREFQASRRDFARRFPFVYIASAVLLLLLFLAAMNGLLSYGLEYWEVPLLGLATYVVPLLALLFAFTYPESEKRLSSFLAAYSGLTSIALIGTALEYFRVDSSLLGAIAMPGDYIRHLWGVQIRMLSGFYRGPDIMGWHAATLACIGIAMSLKEGFSRRAWPWIGAASWGFLCCMISGRRKAVYYVLVFVAAFLWRYFRRMKTAELIVAVFIAVLMLGLVQRIASNETASAYTKGVTTSRDELYQRLVGNVFETFRQFGWIGAGLGAATQGAQHLLEGRATIGWQESGTSKLAVELGIQGVVGILVLGAATLALFLVITRVGDIPGSSQHMRVTLFALVIANIFGFMGSAQAYNDPFIGLMAAFFAGGLFATAALDERVVAVAPVLTPATAT